MLVLQSTYIRPEYFTQDFSLFPAWPRFDAQRALHLFGVTMAVLLAPKAFGLFIALIQPQTRRASGGGVSLVLSTIVEIVMSSLLAPIMMLIQSGSVMQILLGRDTGWNPQRRDDGSIPFRDIVRRHRSHVVLGFLSLVAGLLISPSLVAWMSPTIAGLILAINLSWASGQRSIGLFLKRLGLLRTPEETHPPEIAVRANVLAAELARAGFDGTDSIAALQSSRELRELHEAYLPPAPARRRGDIDHDRVMAEAKLRDARTVEDAQTWLNRKERTAVLNDFELIARVATLPIAEANAVETAA